MLENLGINKFFLNNFFKNIKLNKPYKDKLSNKTFSLQNQKKKFSLKNSDDYSNITYIVSIVQTRTDTFLKVTDINGNLYYALDARTMGFKSKAKRKARHQIIKFFLNTFLNSDYYSFIKKTPIALHFVNTGFVKFRTIRRLKKFFYIEVIRLFNTTPFNGCRAKKLRRKR